MAFQRFGRRVEGGASAAGFFGGDLGEASAGEVDALQEASVGEAADAKIGEARARRSFAAVDEDVGGLDVLVENSGRGGGGDGFATGVTDLEAGGEGYRGDPPLPIGPLAQVAAFGV